MHLRVYSRRAIERAAPPNVPHVVISITDRAADPARLPDAPDHRLAVLRVSFLDVDPASDDEISPDDYPAGALFARDHARQIWDLLRAHHARIARVLVHCNAGVSRSPAVAAAISRALLGHDDEYFRTYRPKCTCTARCSRRSRASTRRTSPRHPTTRTTRRRERAATVARTR